MCWGLERDSQYYRGSRTIAVAGAVRSGGLHIGHRVRHPRSERAERSPCRYNQLVETQCRVINEQSRFKHCSAANPIKRQIIARRAHKRCFCACTFPEPICIYIVAPPQPVFHACADFALSTQVCRRSRWKNNSKVYWPNQICIGQIY